MGEPVFLTVLEEDLVQRVGTRLTLTVEVEPSESEKVFFEWRGPSESLSADDGRVTITETGSSSTAEIHPLHLQDQGTWTCSAKNRHGVAQSKCNVLAQVPKSYKAPVFLEELVAGLSEQGTVSLECKVVGIPSPALRWFRDGEEIRSGDVFALQANLDKPVSVYRCDAVNCLGTVSSTAVLDISKSLSTHSKTAPVLVETLADKKVKIGELVELSVAVSRVSLPARAVWWNHGAQIAEGEKYALVEDSEGRFSCIINPVELCDDGEWKVTVDNSHGQAAAECTITLRVPKNYRKPRFVEALRAVLTKEGLVSFECKVVGYPTPLLRWFKDGAELKPGDVYQLSGSRSLGTYSCLARNCMGEAVSTAALTVEDIGEKFPESRGELRFLVPLQDASVKIGDRHRFSVQVTYSPCLELEWRRGDTTVGSSDRVTLSKEDGGFYHCDIAEASLEDEGEWGVMAKDGSHTIDTCCLLTVTVPKHYKKPRFLEPLKAVLTEEGAVNLECKVIGVPQPSLTWYKDGLELKAGDIHRLMSGKDGSCCLGTYTCVATNCMGQVTSSAALLGFEDTVEADTEPEAHAIGHELQTPDISDGQMKPFSLSTIQEERTSQMMSPEAAQQTETLRQQSLEQDEQSPVNSQHSISIGKLDADGELSISIGNQELTLSLYQTPDLSEKDAKNICEMFAEELAESVNESNYVELPPLRFTKETAKASNINMEAIVVDIDQGDMEEYEAMKKDLENIDDLQTECDIDEDIAEWNEEPVKGTEFEALTCEEVFEYDETKKDEAEKPTNIKVDPASSAVLESPVEVEATKTEKVIPTANTDTGNQTAQPTTNIEASASQPNMEELIKEAGELEEKLEKAVIITEALEKDVSAHKSLETEGTSEASTVIEALKEDKEPVQKAASFITASDSAASPNGEVKVGKVEQKPSASKDEQQQPQTLKETVFADEETAKTSQESKTPLKTESQSTEASKQSVAAHKPDSEEVREHSKHILVKEHSEEVPAPVQMIKDEVNTKQRNQDEINTQENTKPMPDIPTPVERTGVTSSQSKSEQDATTGKSNEPDTLKCSENQSSDKISSPTESEKKPDSEIKSDTKIDGTAAETSQTSETGEVKQKISKVVGLQKKSAKSKNKKEESAGQLAPGQGEELAKAEKHVKDATNVDTQGTHTPSDSKKEDNAVTEEKLSASEDVQKEKTLDQTDQQQIEDLEKRVLHKSTDKVLVSDTSYDLQENKTENKEDDGVQRKNSVRQKKHSNARQQSEIPDSEEVPDIETFNDGFPDNKDDKDLLSQEDDLDLDDEQEFRKSRRASSYEETLANMDPELLAELGLTPDQEGKEKSPSQPLDLSQLPTETTLERMSRIEEKASQIVVEDDPMRKSRSRSRSRSKSRPPNLDTVVEQRKEEESQARYYDRLACGLDTIKESPSTASMLGALQGGLSSASVNTVMQANSTTDVPTEVVASPGPKTKAKKTDRISEEKDIKDNQDTTSESTEDSNSAKQKKPKHKAKRSNTKQLHLEESLQKSEDEAQEKLASALDEAEEVLKEASRLAEKDMPLADREQQTQQQITPQDASDLGTKNIVEAGDQKTSISKKEKVGKLPTYLERTKAGESIEEEKRRLEEERVKNKAEEDASIAAIKEVEAKMAEEIATKKAAFEAEQIAEAKKRAAEEKAKKESVAAEETEAARKLAEAESERVVAEKAEAAKKTAKADAAGVAAKEAEAAKKHAEAEAARVAAEKAEAAEKVAKADEERVAEEKAKAARAAAEEAEAAKKLAEAETARVAAEKAEAAEKEAKADAEKVAEEKAKAARAAAEEAEALRIAAEEAEVARKLAEAESERIAAEKAEATKKIAEAEAARVAAEEAEVAKKLAEAEAARIAAEKAEAAEKEAKAESERVAAEKAEAAKKIAEAEAARVAAEEAEVAKKLAEAEAARVAAEKAKAAEKVAKADAERVAEEKAKAARAATEEAEVAKKLAEAEAARVAAEKAEAAEKVAKAEAERVAEEKAKATRAAAEEAKALRKAEDDAKAARVETEKAEAARKAADKAETANNIAKAKAERVAAEEAEAAKKLVEAETARVVAKEAEAKRIEVEQKAKEERIMRGKEEDKKEIKAEQMMTMFVPGYIEKDSSLENFEELEAVQEVMKEEKQRRSMSKTKSEEPITLIPVRKADYEDRKQEKEETKNKTINNVDRKTADEIHIESVKEVISQSDNQKRSSDDAAKKAAEEAEEKTKAEKKIAAEEAARRANEEAETKAKQEVKKAAEEAAKIAQEKKTREAEKKIADKEAKRLAEEEARKQQEEAERKAKQEAEKAAEEAAKKAEEEKIKEAEKKMAEEKTKEAERKMAEEKTKEAEKKMAEKKAAKEAEEAAQRAKEEAEAMEKQKAKKAADEAEKIAADKKAKEAEKKIAEEKAKKTAEEAARREKEEAETRTKQEAKKASEEAAKKASEEAIRKETAKKLASDTSKAERTILKKKSDIEKRKSQNMTDLEDDSSEDLITLKEEGSVRASGLSKVAMKDELRKISASSTGHYSSHEEESMSGSLAPRYHSVTSPSPTQLAVTRDLRDSRLSPTYDSRSRNISGEGHYRDTVEKSLQTSHNLMSVVTGSITPSQPKTRPASQASKPSSKKNQPTKEAAQAALRKQAELEKSSVAGTVVDIMIKEVGDSWVSLCWKKPEVTRGSPVITYKVEAWLCGEGAFWVELGRTPIPQFDAFNLKPNKCYHFRVTARNKRGWGDAIMTSHKVDLSRPTVMPTITSDLDPIVKALSGSPLRLPVQVSGEPRPKVTWMRDGRDITESDGLTVTNESQTSVLEISSIDATNVGKYTVTAANLAGRTTKAVQVQAVENGLVFEGYTKFRKWQGLVQKPLAPFMVNAPRDRRVQAGQAITLTLRVVSNPWPQVRWYKDDEQILPDDYTKLYSDADFQHLQMDDVTLDHGGNYSVEAFNELGSVRSHFTVIVDSGLDRYMPPFFTKELTDLSVPQGSNLLLHCRVESYPYIGVTWHQSGSKLRQDSSTHKLVDDDGNIVLVVINAQTSHGYTCSILNEIAENSSSCQVEVVPSCQPLVALDEDIIRHSVGCRLTKPPPNPSLREGQDWVVEVEAEGATSVLLSRDFIPKSIDRGVFSLTKSGSGSWTGVVKDLGPDQAGLYFITARNSSTEEKYAVMVEVVSAPPMDAVTDCGLEQGVGAPLLAEIGPMFVRDGDDMILKTSLRAGRAPFSIDWTHDGRAVVWSSRVAPYNREGCVGLRILGAGPQDEGTYTCSVSNSEGGSTFTATLLVDFAEQKESELMVELCNCPMLDSITPLMSWSNTPIGTPRRTPLPTPHGTPLLTPRATPRATPRGTPRASPLPSRGYNPGEYRSPSRSSLLREEDAPPPRRRFVQPPEIFSSFSSKQVDEGGSVELKCFISCAPLTTTTWEKDGIPLLSSNLISLSEKTGVRTMTLHCAKPGDSGSYRMTITNSSGTASCAANITVRRKAAPYASTNPSLLSVPRSPYSSLGRTSTSYSSSRNSSSSAYSSYSSTYSSTPYSSYRSYL